MFYGDFKINDVDARRLHREIFWGADLRRSAGDIFAQICDPVGSLWKKKFIKNCAEFQETKFCENF